jgi:mannosyltransferase OCH1-like enzyme
MKNNFKTYIAIAILFISTSCIGLSDVDFNEFNSWDMMDKLSIQFIDESEEDVTLKKSLLTQDYERLKPSKITPQTTAIIPKIFHRIWLGTNEMPKNYQYYLETCKKLHPGWEIKLWREEDIIRQNFPNMDLYWTAQGYAERSDLIRYDILKKYGGLYTDTDIECFQSFDDLHYLYDFYVSVDPAAVNHEKIHFANGLMGSIPNHPLIIETIANIRKNWDKNTKLYETKYSAGNGWWHTKNWLAVQRTMYPLTEVIFSFLQNPDHLKYKSMMLPSGYNLPYYFVEAKIQEPKGIIKKFKEKIKRLFYKGAKVNYCNTYIIKPETISFHHYTKSSSLMKDEVFEESLFAKPYASKNSNSLLKHKDKYFVQFQDLFNNNFPTKVEYQKAAQVPEIIYLYNSNELSTQQLDFLKNRWQQENKFFTIAVVNDDYLVSLIPDQLKFLDMQAKIILARFYLLNKTGGVFVESSFIPADLQEFNYKYSFYGKFKNLFGIYDTIELDTAIIASKKNHIILTNLIKDVEEEASKNKEIEAQEIKNLYLEDAYKFYELDGKNVIFTENIFEQKR